MDDNNTGIEQATLLVAGDHDFSRLIRVILEDVGYHVLTAPNGEEALKTLQRSQPDLIISDTTTPIMDGTQLLEAVRATPEGSTIPFILIFAGVRKAATAYAESLGAYCIVGHFYPQELLSAIQVCLKRSDGLRDS